MSFLENYFLRTHKSKQNKAVIAYLAAIDHLKETAPSVATTILKELQDQRSSLKLIASENYSSLTVQLAMGNLLTDKYCEGYPFHRFYAGCENVDFIEAEAVETAKFLFEADAAYVQPHSGADANLVAFWTILTQTVQNKELETIGKKTIDELTPDEFERVRQALCHQTVLGLSLSSGGHLTHGYRHNVSAKMMRAESYDVDPLTGLLDYDAIAKKAREVNPKILLAGYSAYPRKIDFAKMREIADSVGAVLMVDMAHFAGLVAGKAFQGNYNPIPFAQIITTTTHKTLRGPRGGMVLANKEFADTLNKGCPLVLGGPLPHVIAAKAIAFKEASQPDFRTYAKKVIENAQALAESLMERGLKITTGGTDNHLLVVDLTSLGFTGRLAETVLRKAGLTANRNMIPFDKNGAWYTSGIRLGTPAMTTLGMGIDEMKEIADLIVKVLCNTQTSLVESTGQPSKSKGETNPQILQQIQERIKTLLHKFPLYPEIDITI